MKRPNIAKDILSNRIYGKDYQNSKNQSFPQVYVFSIMEVPCIALEVFKKLEATHSYRLTQLSDFPKVKILGKSLDSVSQTHNLIPAASKMETMKSFSLVVSMTIPLKQFTSTETQTLKPKVKSLTFKILIVSKNLISSLAMVFTSTSRKNIHKTRKEHFWAIKVSSFSIN